MSETDPWAKVTPAMLAVLRTIENGEHEIVDCPVCQGVDALEALMAYVDAARAAESAQRQQEIAEKDAHLGRMLSNRYDADVVELRAELAAKDETTRQQAKQMATLEVERDRLKAALSQITALDFEKFNGRHNFYSGAAMFVKAWLLAYAALTPQGQSTDGETR